MFLSDVSKLSRGSHAKVKVQCQFQCVDNCKNIVELEYKSAMNTVEKNGGKYICLPCSNPNFDRNLMEKIDTFEKAYLLGWIASDGCISPDSWAICIKIHEKDIQCLEKLRDIVCPDIEIKHVPGSYVSLTINSRKIYTDVCRHLCIERGNVVKFPKFNNEELSWAFIRGYFE